MQRLILSIVGIVSLGIAVFAAGCGKSNSAGTAGQGSTKTESAQPGAASNASNQAVEQGAQDSEITKAMAELSAEDRVLAMKQKVCPVTGEALGSMGVPLKMEVKGQTVFLCCEGCKDKLLGNPDEYLAKINK
jgi:YHS domain-containing protein